MLCLDITQRFLFQRESDLQRSSHQRVRLSLSSFFFSKSSGLKVCFLSGRLKLPKTLGESKAWSESPQQYCTLCAAAPSPSSRCNSWERGNCCLSSIVGPLGPFMHKSFHGAKAWCWVKYGFSRCSLPYAAHEQTFDFVLLIRPHAAWTGFELSVVTPRCLEYAIWLGPHGMLSSLRENYFSLLKHGLNCEVQMKYVALFANAAAA